MPLAQALLQQQYRVKGSTTTIEKLATLQENGIDPYLIQLEKNPNATAIQDFLQQTDVLIISVPPGLRLEKSSNFVEKIESLIPLIAQSGIKNVVFISSISVYSDAQGQIDDQTFAQPETESGKQLLQCENLLIQNPAFQTLALRFGGLIGPERHPVFSMSGKFDLKNADAPINLIHLEDCIGIILHLIKTGFSNQTLNAVAPFHPSRKDYYGSVARSLKLPEPQFQNAGESGKTVNLSISLAGSYVFKHPQL